MAVSDVRENVLEDVRQQAHALACDGLSPGEIDNHMRANRSLSAGEEEVLYLISYHAVRAVRGR